MKLMKNCCQWGKGVAEGDAGVQVVSRLLAVVQRLEVSRGFLSAGRDEAVANGPQLWLRVLLDVPRGSFGVKLLALWLARSRMFGRRCSWPT